MLSDRTRRKQRSVQDPSGSKHLLIILPDSLGHLLPLANCSIDDRQTAVREVFEVLVVRADDLSDVFPTLPDIIGKRSELHKLLALLHV